MLKLKNVSKFYYNKGVIASGFTKVSAEFNIGEFVVITGESGSGKSTLLNVISGLDSYQEGEMYIDGYETSHYGENEFEEYRKKYVSNIFQNFNLVNSYSVYQNVELVLLMNGHKKKDVKGIVLELIDKVGLRKYKNTKVSKLSGGQKQRVAIARALAKETPIIVCDEPTANLDSKSSIEIIKLLKEISKDKLVVLVTHDYSLVEELATRVIKMHDGKIVSDKKIIDIDNDKVNKVSVNNKNIGIFNIIRLGVRNTFNIIPKFLLIFIVFLFVTVSILTEYGSFRKNEYETSNIGYNYYFNDLSDTRIIIKKKDGSFISSSEFDEIKKLDNVDYIEENDILLDNYIWFESIDEDRYYMDGTFKNISRFSGKLDHGRMPINDNEVIFLVNEYEYYFNELYKEAMEKTYYLDGDKNNIAVKVVGIKYIPVYELNNQSNAIYGSGDVLDRYMMMSNLATSDIMIKINNRNYNMYDGVEFVVLGSDKVSSGNAIVHENISYACKDFNCKNKDLNISVENINYKDSLSLKISNVYNDKNSKNMLGIDKDNNNYGAIFINMDDYNKLFNKDSYQASVFVLSVDYVDDIEIELDKLGYDTLVIKKTMSNDGIEISKIIKIVKLVITVVLLVTLFFISYFVIRLILKSRNIYFSTLRILGATKKQTKRILDIELFVNSSLAYITYIIFVILVMNDVIKIDVIKSCMEYLNIYDYILMYIILMVMSYLISSRFSLKIFKKSAMNTYREEV